MISDVPLGAFLSGGIDSSLITALMQEHSSNKIKTFTVGFEETSFDESVYAKRVANYLGTDHTEYFVTSKEALDVIPQIPHIYDCLLYTSPSPRDRQKSRMPSSA